MLEDAPVRAQPCAGQLRFDQGVIVSAVEAALALAETADQAVHIAQGALTAPDREQPRQVEHAIEVDGGVVAGQLQGELEGAGQAFVEGERDHLEDVALQGLESETQVALAGHGTSLLIEFFARRKGGWASGRHPPFQSGHNSRQPRFGSTTGWVKSRAVLQCWSNPLSELTVFAGGWCNRYRLAHRGQL